MSLRIGSLCTGYGGLDMAVRAVLDAEVLWHAQYEPLDKNGREVPQHAAAILAHHWPRVPNFGDITTIPWAAMPAVDVITAGYPCSPISGAGLGLGELDARWIWPHVREAVCVLRPRLVFLENVAIHRRRGLDRVAGDLAAIGYDARWMCLRAGDPAVGAPHARDRWFCVAAPAADAERGGWDRWARHVTEARRRDEPTHRGDAVPGPVSLLPTPSAGNFNDGESLESWLARRERNKAKKINGNGQGTPLGIAVALLPSPPARDWKSGASNLLGTNSRPLNEVAVNLLADVRLPGPQWIATDGTDYGPAIRRWEAITGHPAPEPTEPGTRGNRRLNPAFAEWMMGLEPGHVTGVPGIPRSAQLHAIGNGVVPQQAAAAYTALLNPPAVIDDGALFSLDELALATSGAAA